MRRVIPYSVLPLALIACALSSSPWLRAFPSGVIGVPLFGAALLSVLVPLIVVGIGVRRLLLTALIDVVLFVFYELLVTLREPTGFGDLWIGLVHGPSQILTFALPLVSPRTLLVAPVALCWLAGAILGECVARGWQSVVPYAVLITTFGLSYAATVRAISSSADGRRYDTLLAGGLLLTMLLMRAAQAWIDQDRSAEATQVDGTLPLRGLLIGAVASLVVALAAAGAVQSSAFTGQPVTPARVPPLNQTHPLTPVSFIAGLRPSNPKDAGKPLFTVTFDQRTSRYVSIASVDDYDGSGWTFDRTFRPSGGVIPPETDPTLRTRTVPVVQRYSIDAGPMTSVPWMPYLHRPAQVSGASVNINAASGMIVPSGRLQAGETYTVSSNPSETQFSTLPENAVPSVSGDGTDTQLPGAVTSQLGTLITTLAQETGVSSADPISFLQAVSTQFRTQDVLSGGPATAAPTSGPRSGPSPARSTRSAKVSPSGKPSKKTSSSRTPSRPKRTRAKPPRSKVSSTPHRFVAPVLAPKPKSTSARPKKSSRPTKVMPTTSTKSTTPATPSAKPTGSVEAGGNGFADVLASIRQNRSATPEQYATLTALIARSLRVQARVVSGFRIQTSNDTATLPSGTYRVDTSEAWTWVEIPITNVGWVVLDPSPSTYSGHKDDRGRAEATESASPTPTQSVQISRPNSSEGNNGAGVLPKSNVPKSHHASPLTIAAIIVIAIVAALLALLVILLLRKRLRVRRRRRVGDPRQRLIGAWQEALDVLAEVGMPELDSLTGTEVSEATATRFGGDTGVQARYLGDAANAALFGPTTWVDPTVADAAWDAQRNLARSVRRLLPWRSRIGASLRYHRSHRERPLVGPASWAAAASASFTTSAGSRGGRHADRSRRRPRARRAR